MYLGKLAGIKPRSSGAFNIVSNNNVDGTGAVTPSGPDGQAIPGTSLWSTIDPTSNTPGSSAQNPSFYNEMEGNVINDGTVFTDGPSFSNTLHQPDYPLMRGNVIANNEVTNPPSNGSSSPAGTVMESGSGTWGRDNLIINESVSGVGSPHDVSIGSGYDRTIVQGSIPVADSGKNTVSVQ